jgi:hypothetical protein
MFEGRSEQARPRRITGCHQGGSIPAFGETNGKATVTQGPQERRKLA